MKIKLLLLSMCLIMSASALKAQEQVKSHKVQTQNKQLCCAESKHSINISVSDGLTLGFANFFGMGLADAILGTERIEQKSSLVFGLGYRYSINRFRIGADLAFAKVSSKVKYSSKAEPYVKENEINFMVLPTVEFVYFKHKLIELYGSAAAGVDFIRYSETALNNSGKELVSDKSKFGTQFAFQANPIGFRIGNNRIGGFVELGLGYKGFVTTGLSLKF